MTAASATGEQAASQPLVSCLCPTYNRCPSRKALVEESIECFLRQDYARRELIVLNDTPGQTLRYEHPLVRVYNIPTRFPTLSDKIRFMIDESRGDILARWDDDDIHLPWRLSYSVARLGDTLEWRADNHWYCPGGRVEDESRNPGGASHGRAVWRRELLDRIGGYPADCSGWEDAEFNRRVAAAGISPGGHIIPRQDLFTLYRWGVSDHLSAVSGSHEALQRRYDELGRRPIVAGDFELQPHWREDYVALHRAAVDRGASRSR